MSEFPHGAGRESSRRDWRAAARAWGPPGNERLTTSTGLAADSALAGGHGSKLGRRALSIAAMLLGALIGGLLVLKVDNPAPPVLGGRITGDRLPLHLPSVAVKARVGRRLVDHHL